jgi:hypothetical protein
VSVLRKSLIARGALVTVITRGYAAPVPATNGQPLFDFEMTLHFRIAVENRAVLYFSTGTPSNA